ncbi:hypothetical protein E1193_20225, partial [Micromonospora sp. KC606]|uniref:hypothetical protein n=1 Tax=Micromonospora sp. KC606 TaxID=2530379 RepID=UPI0010DD3577
MGSTSWNTVRRTAWVLVAIGILGVGSWVVTKALGARSDATFDQWVGWANVLALPVGALGTALVLLERASRQDRSGGPGAGRRAGPAGPTPRPPGSGLDSPGG